MKPSLSSRFEDPEAMDCIDMDCIDNVAAVEEIDSLLVGPANPTISYALSMQRELPDTGCNALSRECRGKGWERLGL
jgi:hypothetical protein